MTPPTVNSRLTKNPSCRRVRTVCTTRTYTAAYPAKTSPELSVWRGVTLPIVRNGAGKSAATSVTIRAGASAHATRARLPRMIWSATRASRSPRGRSSGVRRHCSARSVSSAASQAAAITPTSRNAVASDQPR